MDPWYEHIRHMYLRASEALRGGAMGKRGTYEPQTVWDLLAAEGNHTLINTLHKVERRETGYTTIIIPTEGFSKDRRTHEAVVEWLKNHCTNEPYSPAQEVKELSLSLHHV
jgi:hypothetical protein